jgi:hypothetical protein
MRTLPSLAVGATIAAGTADAGCIANYQTVVRGRFVRCESGSLHLEASGGQRKIQQDLEERLAAAPPARHDELRERLRRPPPDPVAVVLIDWHVTIAPWTPGASAAVMLNDRPQEFHELVRYWWDGATGTCESMQEGASVDLWVYPPCCDAIPGDYACLVSMNYAAPAPDALRDALSKALTDQPRTN